MTSINTTHDADEIYPDGSLSQNFKPIPYGKGKGYKINEYGQVISTQNKTKFLKVKKNANGLRKVSFKKARKVEEEHLIYLIARTFIPVDENNEPKFVIFKDGNMDNYHVSNLMWSDELEIDDFYKDIPGFEGRYKAGRDGSIRSYHDGQNIRKVPKTLTCGYNDKGRRWYLLTDANGVNHNMLAARAIALAFHPNPDNLPEVDHINTIVDDDRAENLQWITKLGNVEKSNKDINHKEIALCDDKGKILRTFKSSEEAVKEFNLQTASIALNRCALKNKDKTKKFSKSGGKIWKYTSYKEPYILQEGEVQVQMVRKFADEDFNLPGYMITNFGNVIGNNGFSLKVQNPDGCPTITIGGREHFVHVLVARFFVDGWSPEQNEVDHLDTDRSNPRFDNLEWVTRKENCRRASLNRKKPICQYSLEGEFIKQFDSAKDAADILKLSQTHISGCCRGVMQTSGGFIWKFLNVDPETNKGKNIKNIRKINNDSMTEPKQEQGVMNQTKDLKEKNKPVLKLKILNPSVSPKEENKPSLKLKIVPPDSIQPKTTLKLKIVG